MLCEFDSALRPTEITPTAEPLDADVQWTLLGHLYENSSVQTIAVKTQPVTIGRHPEN